MPELPEVEVCRRGVLPGVAGQTIQQVVLRAAGLRHPLPPALVGQLSGCRVETIHRRGKYLLFDCRRETGRGWLLVHLGMTGHLRFVAPGTPAQRHDHVDLCFSEVILRYTDPRRFGVMLWVEGAEIAHHPLLARLGIEPLEAGFDGDWLYQATRGRRGPIKPWLMDAQQVVGVGNIYASESLFRAEISPLVAAGRLGAARCQRLAECVRQTLQEAIAVGGSSIRDYLHSDGSQGYFQIQLAVYGRAGQTCSRCGGTVRQIRQTGRSTFYCPACQH